jgi:DNA-binding LacI/PurR family transcriptional regulator
MIASATDWSHTADVTTMTQLLETNPDLDAVAVASDLLTTGALTLLRQTGHDVPHDVTVGALDDSPTTLTTDPTLTTIHQPHDPISQHLVRALFTLLDDQPTINIAIPTEPIHRNST